MNAAATDLKTRRHAFRVAMSRMKPGEGLTFTIPGNQPFNRIAAQQVNGVAYSLWGKGAYLLRTVGRNVSVIRKP